MIHIRLTILLKYNKREKERKKHILGRYHYQIKSFAIYINFVLLKYINKQKIPLKVFLFLK